MSKFLHDKQSYAYHFYNRSLLTVNVIPCHTSFFSTTLNDPIAPHNVDLSYIIEPTPYCWAFK